MPARLKGGTVAIGNFDGMHLGHQAVLASALKGPRPVVALTFEPHPREFFSGKPVFRLTPADEKAHIARAFGLDGLVVATFDDALARLDADAFIDTVLIGTMGTKHVAVGHDFKFGARRSGHATHLKSRADACGYTVDVVSALEAGGGAVSSSRIRAVLAEGDVASAAALLGYRYRISAPIRHGEKRGRDMGYPTANQVLAPANRLRHGVYAVRIKIDGRWRDGVASFGRRPTFDNGAPRLETFVFDFSGDLYGQVLPVSFAAFLRPEFKFDGMDALIAQMDEDGQKARAVLRALAPLSPLDRALNF